MSGRFVSTVIPFGQLLFDTFVDGRFQFAVILVYGREGERLELSEIYRVGCHGCLEWTDKFPFAGRFEAVHRKSGGQLFFGNRIPFLHSF